MHPSTTGRGLRAVYVSETHPNSLYANPASPGPVCSRSPSRPGRRPRRRPAGGEKRYGRHPAARVPRGSDTAPVRPSAPSCRRTPPRTTPPSMPMSGYPSGTPSSRAQPPGAFPDGRRPPGHTAAPIWPIPRPSRTARGRWRVCIPASRPAAPNRSGRRRGQSRPYPDAVVPLGVEVPVGPGEPLAVPMSHPSQSLPAAPPTRMDGRSGERYAAPGDRSAVPARHRRHEPSGLQQGASPARMRVPDLPGWAAAMGAGSRGVIHTPAVGACPGMASRAAIGAAVAGLPQTPLRSLTIRQYHGQYPNTTL